MNRRGFLRAFAVGSAAGVALPVLDKLDFLIRQPHTIITPGDPFWIDYETQTMGVRRGLHTVNEFYSWIAEQADSFQAMGFKNPMLPVTPWEYTCENNYVIDEQSMAHLKEGTITQKVGGKVEQWGSISVNFGAMTPRQIS